MCHERAGAAACAIHMFGWENNRQNMRSVDTQKGIFQAQKLGPFLPTEIPLGK